MHDYGPMRTCCPYIYVHLVTVPGLVPRHLSTAPWEEVDSARHTHQPLLQNHTVDTKLLVIKARGQSLLLVSELFVPERVIGL